MWLHTRSSAHCHNVIAKSLTLSSAVINRNRSELSDKIMQTAAMPTSPRWLLCALMALSLALRAHGSTAEQNAGLLRAAEAGRPDTVNSLLAQGADPNTENSNGETPLFLAAETGCSVCLQHLLLRGADKDTRKIEWYNGTALMKASIEGHVNAVVTLLSGGADADATNTNGNTALILAAQQGHMEVVRTLLATGANINAINTFGSTALHWAARKRLTEVVRSLLAAGANPNLENSIGERPLYLAATHNCLGCVTELLQRVADKESRKSGWFNGTALMSASEDGHLDVVRALLAAAVDVNATNAFGDTTLVLAVKKGHMEVVRTLLAAGADVDARISGWYNGTALMMASRENHLDLVRLLISEGADVNAKMSDDDTAILLAARRGHLEVVRALLTAGADTTWKRSCRSPYYEALRNGYTEVADLIGQRDGGILGSSGIVQTDE